jgi:predicted RND superfamily exporter protein
LWGLMNESIGLASTVIVAVCMGVVIDDSIHMIYSHIDARKRLNLSGREASAYALHRVGAAVVTTTIVLVVGFSVLLFSEFQLNSAFGGCSALILVCALAFDLRILPELLVWASDEAPHN